MNLCQCRSPEPALIEHGLYSFCEKCGQYIGEAPPRSTQRIAHATMEGPGQCSGGKGPAQTGTGINATPVASSPHR